MTLVFNAEMFAMPLPEGSALEVEYGKHHGSSRFGGGAAAEVYGDATAVGLRRIVQVRRPAAAANRS